MRFVRGFRQDIALPSSLRKDHAPLTAAKGSSAVPHAAIVSSGGGTNARSSARDLEWSALMAQAQAGDRQAYRRILEDITPFLRALAARRHRDARDVEDTVQDVLLTVHAIRHTYDPQRPFTPWLAAIAHRRIVDRLRQQGRSRVRERAFEADLETFAAPRANNQEAASEREALRDAIESLPLGQRRAVKLLKLEERSLKQAAEASGMSIPALKVATHRALKNLRRMLVKKSDDT